MSESEIINLIESEITNVKFKKRQSIPMGASLHFSFSCLKEELDRKMIEKFGRSFTVYLDGDACFFVTNGTKLQKI